MQQQHEDRVRKEAEITTKTVTSQRTLLTLCSGAI